MLNTDHSHHSLDQKIVQLVERYIAPIRAEAKAPIAFTRVPLQLADFSKGQFESTFANLVTDVLVDYVSVPQIIIILFE